MKKAKLTREEVKHVADLANLDLTEEEIEKFQKQLSAVLDYFSVLEEAQTTGIEPTSQVTGLEDIFREDKKSKSLSSKQALSNTKNQKEGMFKVKAILE